MGTGASSGEVLASGAKVLASSGVTVDTQRTPADAMSRAHVLLSDISGINGRLQDLRDGYTLTKELYEAAWKRENRPYWLGNVTVKYDLATQLWQSRADKFFLARSEFGRTKKLPPGESIGFPPAPAVPPLVP